MHLHITLIFLLLLPSLATADLTIHYIDVGHGDAILIQCEGKNLLLDSGDYNTGDTVLTYLKKPG